MQFVIKPFPDQIGEYIELPAIEELMKLPVLKMMLVEDVRKLGIPIFDMLLDAAPITGTKRHAFVYSRTQFLYEGCTATIRRFGDEFDSEWHIDNAVDYFEDRDVIHLLQTDSSTPTEFNEHEIVIDIDETLSKEETRHYINANRDDIGIVAKAVPPNRFVTFGRHLHRAGVPREDSFRFTFGILESDYMTVKQHEDTIDNTSHVFIGHDKVKNISHENGVIKIYRGEEEV